MKQSKDKGLVISPGQVNKVAPNSVGELWTLKMR